MTGFYDRIIQLCPYIETLGIRFSYDDKGLFSELPYDIKLVGNPLLGALHGGVIGSFMEISALASLVYQTNRPEGDTKQKFPKPVNLFVSYLRKAKLSPSYARASLTKQGQRVSHISVSAWQEDENISIARLAAHFLL